jgi:ABC-type transport system involved in cytochrome bd biosynthesis fused ATPase/permease subunit
MPVLRYLDVCLVLATAPFVLAAGMPLVGYLLGAAAWLLTRLAAAALQARALRQGDPRTRAGLQVAVMLGRVWFVALAVLAARYAGGRDDGIMAAALVLAAFTVYLALAVVYRDPTGLHRNPRPS